MGKPDKFGTLKELYEVRRREITRRLSDFERIWREATEDELFAELVFCLFTPQSKARSADRAVRALKAGGLLGAGTFEDIREHLKGVRFPNNKTRYMLKARELFMVSGRFSVREELDVSDLPGTRDKLASSVKGLGYKEASHFLRNVGLGGDLAILDVHVIRNMRVLGLLDEDPVSFSRRRYMELERLLRGFCDKVGIPLSHMDLLLWSKETGEVFK